MTIVSTVCKLFFGLSITVVANLFMNCSTEPNVYERNDFLCLEYLQGFRALSSASLLLRIPTWDHAEFCKLKPFKWSCAALLPAL